MIEKTIETFMKEEYLFDVKSDVIEFLQQRGFEKCDNEQKQCELCDGIQRTTNDYRSKDLVAKVFLLAYSYNFVLSQSHRLIRRWSGQLGVAEYRLSKKVKQPSKKRLLEKGLEHLLKSRDEGNISKENADFIGECYFGLEDYIKALDFLLESKERGNDSQQNASRIFSCYCLLGDNTGALSSLLQEKDKEKALSILVGEQMKRLKGKDYGMFIGSCYFHIGKYYGGISYYSEIFDTIKSEPFDPQWMHNFDQHLKDSFNLLIQSKASIRKMPYRRLLYRFNTFYKRFIEYWKKHDPYKRSFQLVDTIGGQTFNKFEIALQKV